MRKIVKYPDKALRIRTEEIREVSDQLIEDINELKKILKDCENGAGLAATQLGMEWRLFGIKEGKSQEVRVIINPQIIANSGKRVFPIMVSQGEKDEDFLEGCLSFPDYYGTVKRYLDIKVSWQELSEGKLISKEKKLSGFEAIVFQHEADHLDGVLFIDRIKEDGGKFYKQVGKEMVAWDLEKVIKGEL